MVLRLVAVRATQQLGGGIDLDASGNDLQTAGVADVDDVAPDLSFARVVALVHERLIDLQPFE